MLIPKDITENIDFRMQLKIKCEEDQLARDMVIDLIEKDIINFFCMFLWTYDPRKAPSDRPFITYGFQEDMIKKIDDNITIGKDLLIDKCRDMGVTWCVLGTFYYRWLVKDETFLTGSRKESLVDDIGDMDTHFERLRYLHRMIPDWLLEHYNGKEVNSGYLQINKTHGPQIVGESTNTDFSRQGRYKAILLDEFAFVDKAELVWRATGDSSPCRIPVSTPNGRHNHFARLRFSGDLEVFSLDWHMHPDKDKAWYAQETSRRTKKDLAQEVERNYTVSAGEPFYAGFSRAIHVQKMELNQARPLVPVFDYGFLKSACTLHQIDAEGRWIIFDTVLGEEMIVEDFGQMVMDYCMDKYKGYDFMNEVYGDPAGRQSPQASKKSCERILKEMGYKIKSVPSNRATTNYAARKNLIEGRLKRLINGIPALVVNDCPNNEIVIEGFEGGYRYPDSNKYGKMKEAPVDDGYYEHPMNTIEYFGINKFRAGQIVTGTAYKQRKYRVSAYEQSRASNAGFGYSSK